jgi:hypothetical protein
MFPDLKVWLDHFEYHAQKPRRVPEHITNVLSPEEKQLIAGSIATFQLGEQSAGNSLRRAAQRFARKHDAPQLVRLTELLIREEQHHATLLREFMESHAMPLKHNDWTDHVFRRVRRLAGFELYLSVLVTAELIGNIYYRALEIATGCKRLRALCCMVVADELAHVGYESELLLTLRARRPAPVRGAVDFLHRAFLFAVAAVVWYTHRDVLRRARYRMSTFLRACHAQYSFYLGAPRSSVPPEGIVASACNHVRKLFTAGRSSPLLSKR